MVIQSIDGKGPELVTITQIYLALFYSQDNFITVASNYLSLFQSAAVSQDHS